MQDNLVPGTMPTCIEHSNRLMVLDTKVVGMSEEICELTACVRDLVKFQVSIVAQLRAVGFVFAVVQPIVTAMMVWMIQQYLQVMK